MRVYTESDEKSVPSPKEDTMNKKTWAATTLIVAMGLFSLRSEAGCPPCDAKFKASARAGGPYKECVETWCTEAPVAVSKSNNGNSGKSDIQRFSSKVIGSPCVKGSSEYTWQELDNKVQCASWCAAAKPDVCADDGSRGAYIAKGQQCCGCDPGYILTADEKYCVPSVNCYVAYLNQKTGDMIYQFEELPRSEREKCARITVYKKVDVPKFVNKNVQGDGLPWWFIAAIVLCSIAFTILAIYGVRKYRRKRLSRGQSTGKGGGQ